ncbi:unnamed protein product [Rhizopus stolonifer]
MSAFTIPANQQEFNEILANNELVLVDFTATWCGPCKLITPVLEKHAAVYKNVVFVKVDVDDLSDIAAAYNIRAMPTLFFFKKGEKVAEVVGAKVAEIELNLKTFTA